MGTTFKGRIPSTPFCVDDFSSHQLQSFQTSPLSTTCPLIFFLSHLHTDHTCGLSSSWHHGPIYASPLTAHLLLSRFSLPPSLVHPIPYHTPTPLPLSPHSPLTFTLTLLPTLHCPGSTLFLFDGYFGRIIYTGDLRLTCPPPPPLLSPPHPLLYLDDTFAHHPHPFLTRTHCVTAITRIARAHPSPHRLLINGDLLGKEDVLVLVAVRLSCLLAVEPDKWRMLQALWDAGYDLNDQTPPPPHTQGEGQTEADDGEEEEGGEDARALSHPTWLSYFTTNKAETNLHVVPKRLLTRAHIRALNAQEGVRTVGVLMTGWAGGGSEEAGCEALGGCVHGVRYSSHCSQEELKALVKEVRPAVVRGISTGGSGEWCREWLSGAGERVVEVPEELTEGLWNEGEQSRRMRACEVRRQRSDVRWSMVEGRRRGFVLEPRSSQSADEADDESDGVVDEIRLDVDDDVTMEGGSEARVGEDLSGDGEEEVESQSPSPPPRSALLSPVAMDEPIRRFSLPCNPARSHFLSRLSLSSFEVWDADLPSPPSPRRVPAFLSRARSVVPDDAQWPSPSSHPLARRPVSLPLPTKRRALSSIRPSLALTSLTSDAARGCSSPPFPTPLPSHPMPSASHPRLPSTPSLLSSSHLLDSVVFPPHIFPQLPLSLVSAERMREKEVEAEEEEEVEVDSTAVSHSDKENQLAPSPRGCVTLLTASHAAAAAAAAELMSSSCMADMPPLESAP